MKNRMTRLEDRYLQEINTLRADLKEALRHEDDVDECKARLALQLSQEESFRKENKRLCDEIKAWKLEVWKLYCCSL